MNEVSSNGVDRRTVLRRSLVAGGVAAAGPVISTFQMPAAAQALSDDGENGGGNGGGGGGVTPVTINFDDLDASTSEVLLTTYAGFTWTKAYVYKPGNPDPYGYSFSSGPNIGFIGFPQNGNPVALASNIGDVSFTSVFLVNPSNSATDPDGSITVTIQGLKNGNPIASQQVVLDNGTSQTVALLIVGVDTLRMSAGGKYFGFDDLKYLPATP